MYDCHGSRIVANGDSVSSRDRHAPEIITPSAVALCLGSWADRREDLASLAEHLGGVSASPVACSTIDRASWLRSALFGCLGLIMSRVADMPYCGMSAFWPSTVSVLRARHVSHGLARIRRHHTTMSAPPSVPSVFDSLEVKVLHPT